MASLPARVRNCLVKSRIASWDGLLSTAKVDRYGLGTATYLVQPGSWRGFGGVAYDNLVYAMRSAGVSPPEHWEKKDGG